jgi:nucleoside-diphosphate-sugar epimerase
VQELQAGDRRIRVVNRSGKAALPSGVELLAGDAADPTFARRACEGAAVVYQALNPPYTQWPQLFPALQAGVLDGAMAAGAKLVSMENVYMYGASGGKAITEELPYAAHTRKGQVRARMAEELLAAHAAGKVRVAIGRASDFFGPGARQSAMGERVFDPILTGKSVQVLGNPDLPHTYTYVPDIGKGLVILGKRDEALGQVWHLPNPQTVTTRRFIELIGEAAGKPVRVQAVPKWLLRGVGLFNAELREVVEMVYEFEEPFVVDDGKFRRAFGDHATPLEDAIRTTLAWYGDAARQPVHS